MNESPEASHPSGPAPRGRASWSGLLRLSLVAVPVQAYPAVSSTEAVQLNQLHSGCGQRIRYEKRCPIHGPVDAALIARGYEYAPDQYVIVEPEELERIRPSQEKALTLVQFVEPEQLDLALLSGRTLYLMPQGLAAHRPYQVLQQALQQRGRWGLARVTLSGHRCADVVRPTCGLLARARAARPAPTARGLGLAVAVACRTGRRTGAAIGLPADRCGRRSGGLVLLSGRHGRAPGKAGGGQGGRPSAYRAAGRAGSSAPAAGSAATQRGRQCQDFPARGPEHRQKTPPEVGLMDSLAPMLAVAGEPFDSPDYLFEIKWDGVRTLAAIEPTGWRLWGRREADYTVRYPELSLLRQLPAGTVLDGELVRLVEGRADFESLLSRHQLVSPRKIHQAAAQHPVTYVVFDLLQLGGRSLLAQPLHQRRQQLEQLIAQAGLPRLVFSQGIVGAGQLFFEQVVSQGHEGVMAKRSGLPLSSWQTGSRLAKNKASPADRVRDLGLSDGARGSRQPAGGRRSGGPFALCRRGPRGSYPQVAKRIGAAAGAARLCAARYRYAPAGPLGSARVVLHGALLWIDRQRATAISPFDPPAACGRRTLDCRAKDPRSFDPRSRSSPMFLLRPRLSSFIFFVASRRNRGAVVFPRHDRPVLGAVPS